MTLTLIKKILLMGSGLLLCSNVTAGIAIKFEMPFYMVVQGKTVRLGDKLNLLIQKFGYPQTSEFVKVDLNDTYKKYNFEQVNKWHYNNGLTFVVVVNPIQELVTEMTISSSDKHQKSYVVASRTVNYLNDSNIKKLENTYKNNSQCLTFFEQGGLGWLDYTIQNKMHPDNYMIFSALNPSQESLYKEKIQEKAKLVQIDSITLKTNYEKLSKTIYCK